MRRVKSYTVSRLDQGIDTDLDPLFYLDRQIFGVFNMRYDQGLLKKDLGWAQFGKGNVANYVVAINPFRMKSGTVWEIVHTPSNVFYIDANSNFAQLNANAFTGNANDYWSATATLDANSNECYVFTNGKDAIQKWDGNAANCSNLSGWANTTARFVNTFKSRLIAGYTTEGGIINSLRIQWSVAGNPEDRANTGSGLIDIYSGTDPITGIHSYKDRMFIFRQNSLWELAYTGGSNYFTPVLLYPNIGCPAPRSIQTCKDGLIFMSQDNIYLFNGVSLLPMASNLHSFVFDPANYQVNSNMIHLTSSAYIEEIDQYWLNWPYTGLAYPGNVLKYDFRHKAWTFRNEVGTAYGRHYARAGVSWANTTGTWANWAGTWGANTAVSTPTILRGDANGVLWEDNRKFPDSNGGGFHTKMFAFPEAVRVLDVRAFIKASDEFYMGVKDENRVLLNSSMFNEDIAGANKFVEYTLPLNHTVKHFQVYISTSAANFEVKWIEPWFIPRVKASKSTPMTSH